MKTEIITLKVTPDQKELIKKYAKEHGTNSGELLRMTILECLLQLI